MIRPIRIDPDRSGGSHGSVRRGAPAPEAGSRRTDPIRHTGGVGGGSDRSSPPRPAIVRVSRNPSHLDEGGLAGPRRSGSVALAAPRTATAPRPHRIGAANLRCGAPASIIGAAVAASLSAPRHHNRRLFVACAPHSRGESRALRRIEHPALNSEPRGLSHRGRPHRRAAGAPGRGSTSQPARGAPEAHHDGRT